VRAVGVWGQRYGFYGALIVSELVLFSPGGEGPLPFAHFDKVIHLTVFGLLAVGAKWRFGWGKGVVSGLLAYAVASELVQGAGVPGRQFDGIDLLADGVAIGLMAVWVKFNRENKRSGGAK
jgi:hypothetical protein